MDRPKVQCCCGRDDCAYLHHNAAALEGLEKDVETAARLGQALLGRHESYMAEAEADRAKMVAENEKLEKQKQEAQAENARIIEENRDLLEQLEGLNQIISESDAHIKTLSTSLESTQIEVRRLAAAASRAEELGAQLSAMELEQARLHDTLSLTEENERSAMQRWKNAECALRDLHDQLDKIENESKREREKHVELLGRMERRREVERELDSAAVRLKGAAAAASLGRNKNGTSVVSHFVRDILQDNANLQLSVVELREMLQHSDEEVLNLRDQLLLHQPLGPADEKSTEPNPAVLLSEDLPAAQPGPPSQELHVHHHYHSPFNVTPPRKERVQLPMQRRQRKRRVVLPPAFLDSSPGQQGVRGRAGHRLRESSSTSTILSQTSASIPSTGGPHQWLNQPSTMSQSHPFPPSLPSSPRSAYRTPSIFDPVERGFDSSRPTSPESNGFASPRMRAFHRKGPSDASISSAIDEAWLEDSLLTSTREHSQLQQRLGLNRTEDNLAHAETTATESHALAFSEPPILEEQEDRLSESVRAIPHDHPDSPDLGSLHHPRLRRTTSQESLISISGMDIHTTASSYSDMSGGPRSLYGAKAPKRIASVGTVFSSTTPVISRTNITISKASVSGDKTSVSLLSSVVSAAEGAGNNQTDPPAAAETATQLSSSQSSQPGSIKKRVGGWVLGKWSSTGTLRSPSPAPSQPPEAASPSSPILSANKGTPKTLQDIMSRPPGVNQKGPILGLRPPTAAPISIQPRDIDEDLLQESLAE